MGVQMRIEIVGNIGYAFPIGNLSITYLRCCTLFFNLILAKSEKIGHILFRPGISDNIQICKVKFIIPFVLFLFDR
jgi:hypothetical protein